MFRSFYLAGFECATGYNMHGEWIDQIAATEHDLHVEADYQRLATVGIHGVREAIRWPLVDRRGRYDFSSVEPFVEAALRHEFDVIWDLFHYGYPDDLDPFSEAFVERFAAYCRAAAKFIAARMHHCYFTPVNEPSYFAWAGGEVGRFAPHARGRGYELKVVLARAALRGIAAIREVCPSARIVNVDPVCRVIAGSGDPSALAYARRFNEQFVFEFWDMVSGRIRPELGGSRRSLDIVGLNYYWTNQWELGREAVPLADDDPRRLPLAELVRSAWRRYGREIVITETSALGAARAPWLHELSAMAAVLIDEGLPLGGICLYPILGMPEWHDRSQWAHMGLWDLEREQNVLERRVCAPMLEALRQAQPVSAERNYSLQRTGHSPVEFHGRLLWEQRRSGACSLRLFRAGRPRSEWILAISVPTAALTIEHVSIEGDPQGLLGELERLSCERLALRHGLVYAGPARLARHCWRDAAEAVQRLMQGTLEASAGERRHPGRSSEAAASRCPALGGQAMPGL